jgi:hypothetical protein
MGQRRLTHGKRVREPTRHGQGLRWRGQMAQDGVSDRRVARCRRDTSPQHAGGHHDCPAVLLRRAARRRLRRSRVGRAGAPYAIVDRLGCPAAGTPGGPDRGHCAVGDTQPGWQNEAACRPAKTRRPAAPA